MNNVLIKFTGFFNKKYIVLLNDKLIKPKKDKTGKYCYNFTCEENTCNIKVFNYFENSSKLWFLMYLLYFFISIFGILDLPLRKKYISQYLDADLNLSENTEFTVKLISFKTNTKFATIEGNNPHEIITNQVFINKTIKKRIKIYKLFKLFFWILAIITAIILIFVL